jgi:hypothetical protein
MEVTLASFRQRQNLLRGQCRFDDTLVGMTIDYPCGSYVSLSAGPRFEPWSARQVFQAALTKTTTQTDLSFGSGMAARYQVRGRFIRLDAEPKPSS